MPHSSLWRWEVDTLQNHAERLARSTGIDGDGLVLIGLTADDREFINAIPDLERDRAELAEMVRKLGAELLLCHGELPRRPSAALLGEAALLLKRIREETKR